MRASAAIGILAATLALGCGADGEHRTEPGEPEVVVRSSQQGLGCDTSTHGSYGIAVDAKNRVWLGSYPQTFVSAFRYDPSTNTWGAARATVTPTKGAGRGVTVDANNTVWVAQQGGGSGGRLTGYDADTLAVRHDVYTGPSGLMPVGVGIGSGGVVWAVNQQSKNLTAYDPSTKTLGYYPPTGDLGGGPYTYSDFTGHLLRTFTAPQGIYSSFVQACAGGGPVDAWKKLSWTATQPSGTAVKVQLRVAATQAALSSARWYPDADNDVSTVEYYVTQPSYLWSLPAKRTGANDVTWAEINVVLVSSPSGAVPSLRSLSLARECSSP